MQGASQWVEPVRRDLELSSRLYGRSRETHALMTAFRRAAGGATEVVLLAGPAGIGKTSLARQLCLPVSQLKGRFIAGKFDQFQRDVPFTAIALSLQDLCEQLLADEATLPKWRANIQAALGASGRVITDLVPSLERIIGPQPTLAALDPAESQNRFHLVFQNFVQVFCRREHPLVLFLDDMQWADPASLHLVSLVLSAPATEALLLIGSYRDNEVTPTHPFMQAVQELRLRSVPIESIELGALGWADIAQLLEDSLHVNTDTATPLAAAIREKTGGNPFFARQFLQQLHSSHLLEVDPEASGCRFDLTAIRAADITENVADFIAQRLRLLEPETQRVVQLAAAVGNRFDVELLARVDGKSVADTLRHLAPALRERLVVPQSGPDAALAARYEFQHDRVQQAAYALIAPPDLPALHLAIGRTMLGAANSPDKHALLFDIVNHMNQGIALIDRRAERVRVAELNHVAAARARDSTAYEVATRCCGSALELLGWDAWEEHYALTLKLHFQLAECHTLTANFDAAFRAIDDALQHARTATDRGRVQTLRTHAYLSQGDMAGAVACGLQAAQLFGLDLPDDPAEIRSQLQKEIGSIVERSSAKGIESLLELPLMPEGDRTALMSLLMHCIPPAYQVNPELFALICCKMVSLSIEHGNCTVSSKGYGSFAVLLSGVLGNFRDGDRFGKLGVELCEKLDDITVRSACYFTWAAFASHWMRPIDESIEQYAQGVKFGLQGGDHMHAAYCAARQITHLMFRGSPLPALREHAAENLELLHRLADATNPSLLRARLRLIDLLTREGMKPSLDGESFDEHAVLTALQAPAASKSLLSHLQTLRLMHRYLARDYSAAYDISQMSAALLPYSVGMITVAEHNFYQSLAIAGMYAAAPPVRREELAAKLAANQKQLRIWADSCPQNFESSWLLVEAERARLEGREADALELYDRAAASAAEQRFVHIEALAHELAMQVPWIIADATRLAGRRTAAQRAWEAWGAHARARLIDAR
jgi:predicted ATPase